MSVFEYVRLLSNRLDARRFVLDMRICGANFYVCNGHFLRLAAADGWGSCWLQCGGQRAAWGRCRRDQADISFVSVEEERITSAG